VAAGSTAVVVVAADSMAAVVVDPTVAVAGMVAEATGN